MLVFSLHDYLRKMQLDEPDARSASHEGSDIIHAKIRHKCCDTFEECRYTQLRTSSGAILCNLLYHHLNHRLTNENAAPIKQSIDGQTNG